jgi:hypothetical protein
MLLPRREELALLLVGREVGELVLRDAPRSLLLKLDCELASTILSIACARARSCCRSSSDISPRALSVTVNGLAVA